MRLQVAWPGRIRTSGGIGARLCPWSNCGACNGTLAGRECACMHYNASLLRSWSMLHRCAAERPRRWALLPAPKRRQQRQRRRRRRLGLQAFQQYTAALTSSLHSEEEPVYAGAAAAGGSCSARAGNGRRQRCGGPSAACQPMQGCARLPAAIGAVDSCSAAGMT